MKTAEDILTVEEMNNIITSIKTYAAKLSLSENLLLKENGEFLFCEEVDEIERMLKLISELIYIDYERRYFYNLSTITFEDINRWSLQLEAIEEQIRHMEEDGYRYNDYLSNIYQDLINKTYKEILYREEE